MIMITSAHNAQIKNKNLVNWTNGSNLLSLAKTGNMKIWIGLMSFYGLMPMVACEPTDP
jgi:hypothetical protein